MSGRKHQQCPDCNVWFFSLIQHLRLSKCSLDTHDASIPENIVMFPYPNATTLQCNQPARTSLAFQPSLPQPGTILDDLSLITCSTPMSSSPTLSDSNSVPPIIMNTDRCDDSFIEAYEPDGSLDAPYLFEGHVDQSEFIGDDAQPSFHFPTPNLPFTSETSPQKKRGLFVNESCNYHYWWYHQCQYQAPLA